MIGFSNWSEKDTEKKKTSRFVKNFWKLYIGAFVIALIIVLMFIFNSCTKKSEMWENTDVIATMDKTITQRGDTLFLNTTPGFFVEFKWHYNDTREHITTEHTEYVVWKWDKREVICKLLDANGKGCWSSPYKVK